MCRCRGGVEVHKCCIGAEIQNAEMQIFRLLGGD
jgi:hypothetical protein